MRVTHRAFGIGAISLMVLVLVMPGVLGQDLTASQGNRTVDLQPTPAFPTDKLVNVAKIGGPSDLQLEKDALATAFMEVGRYVGPYIRTSSFRFTNDKGGTFGFNASFRFTHEQIMSGASEYWVRWPVDTSEYDSYCFRIDGQFDDGGHYDRCFSTVANTPPAFFCPPGPDGILCQPNLNLGNATISDSTGTYIKEWNVILPDVTYTLTFSGHLIASRSPSVWLSIERFQLSHNTSFTFSDYVRGTHHSENLGIYPAFAFNFIQGIGDGGQTAYALPMTGGSGDYIVGVNVATLDPSTNCNHYVSLYVPFSGADNVTWTIRVVYFLDIGGTTYEEWTAGPTRDFLLTSSPSTPATVMTAAGGTCGLIGDTGQPTIYLRPSKPVTFVATATAENNAFGSPSNLQWFLSLGTGIPWGTTQYDASLIPRTLARWISPFISVEFTTGRWAVVTPGLFFSVFDFGWGRAYLFPGEVDLVMFLNNGSAVGFNSVTQTLLGPNGSTTGCAFIQNATGTFQPIAEWVNKLACFIASFAGNIIGTISTVFQAIWGAIQQLGEWLHNALIGFVDLLVKIATDIIDVAEQIVFTLLSAVPFMLVMFIVTKGLPDLTDVRKGATRFFRRTEKKAQRILRRKSKRVSARAKSGYRRFRDRNQGGDE